MQKLRAICLKFDCPVLKLKEYEHKLTGFVCLIGKVLSVVILSVYHLNTVLSFKI